MLIDRLKFDCGDTSLGYGKWSQKLSDSVTFYIDEEVQGFLEESYRIKRSGSIFKSVPVSHLPYDNLFIHFSDSNGLWCVQRAVKDSVTQKPVESLRIIAAIPASTSVSPDLFRSALKNERYFAIINDLENGYGCRSTHHFKNDDFSVAVLIIDRFLSILSCKNIRAKEIHPDPKKNTRRIRKGLMPFHSYYVLQIRTGSDTGLDRKSEWSNRVHMCRGHIKTYTPERPLFGRITGNVWCPPHVRGNKRQGMVHKDYAVNGGQKGGE